MLKPKKGFTLIEILIVTVIIGLLLTLLVVSLNSKQKQIRDMKRIGDIQALRNALEVVKNETGSFDRAYCEVGAVSNCADENKSELLRYMLNLKGLNDPEEQSVDCVNVDQCKSDVCNYAFASLKENDYEILFHLEKGINGLSKGCYSASRYGIKVR